MILTQQICCPETLNICLPGFPCDPEVQKEINALKCYIDDYGDECCAGDDGIESCYPVTQTFQCDDNLVEYKLLQEYEHYEYGQFDDDYGKIYLILLE